MTYRRDTLLYYWVGSQPPRWCVAMGQGTREFERVLFLGDDGPCIKEVGPEDLSEWGHCPGMLEQSQEAAAARWQEGHDEGVASAMEGLDR